MNEEETEVFLKHKEFGVKILTIGYLLLIFVVYISIGSYISNVNDSEEGIYQSLVPLIITGVIGGFSKSLYFSLVDLIFNNDENLVTEKVKKGNRRVEVIVNFVTIVLLLRFLTEMNTNDNIFLTVSIVSISCLILLLAIAMYFKFTPSTTENLRKKVNKKRGKRKKT